jgi:FkbM family methyltransferase
MSVCGLDQRVVQRGIVPFLRVCYQSYRNWQKSRGRAIREKKRLQKRIKFYSRFITKGDLCFDIGANIGTRTEAFLELGAVVVAVEPQKKCSQILREKFGDNSKFTLIEKALDSIEGEKEFYISNAHTLSSMSSEWIEYVKKENLFQNSDWNEKTVVCTTTLDFLMATFGCPVFCKIDVEGFEYNVLQGLSSPAGTVSFEFTRGLERSTVNCINHLSEIGYNKFNYSIGETMSLALSDWVSADEIIEIIASMPKAEGLSGDVYSKKS